MNGALMSADPVARGLAVHARARLAAQSAYARAAIAWPSPSPLPRLATALARVRAGVGSARIACIGDSTTDGQGRASASWPRRLATKLRTGGLPATSDSWFGVGIGATTAAITAQEPRISFAGGGWGVHTQASLGGRFPFCPPADTTSALTFTPDLPSNQIDVWFLSLGGAGTAAILADGAQLATFNTGAGFAVSKHTVTAGGAAAARVWSIRHTGTGGNVFVMGMAARDTALPSVEITNAGWSSSRSGDWVDPALGFYTPLNALATFAPDASVISLGLNDRNASGGTWAAPATPLATYAANIAAIAAAAKAAGDVIGLIPPQSNTAAGFVAPDAVQAQFNAALGAALVPHGAPIVSLPALWGATAGSMRAGMMADERHPNAVGYDAVAELMRDVLVAIR